MSLHVRLFGAIELIAEDQPLPRLATAKAEALLAYLLVEEALRPGTSHRREGLMTLLWPDMPLESAQLNLRQTLYRVRQGLPDDTALVLSDRQAVQINPAAAYGCDVAEFVALLSKAEQEQPPARAENADRGGRALPRRPAGRLLPARQRELRDVGADTAAAPSPAGPGRVEPTGRARAGQRRLRLCGCLCSPPDRNRQP